MVPACQAKLWSDPSHEAGRRALLRDDLRRRVVEHKRVFFAEADDPYATVVPGSFRLLPDSARLEELERDYRGMREMFSEEPPAWPVVVERLRRLEDEINEKTGAGGDTDRKAEG
jgi:hypothetical protein